MDRLSNLLSRFGVRANLFYDGDLCGSASYDGAERRVISICFRPAA